MEEMILSDADLASMEGIDVDSWVHKYIIDEISANIDSDRGSCYFYQQDGVLYWGPIWDYDMTFASSSRNMEPVGFVAKNRYKSKDIIAPYYGVLYENQSFRNRVKEVYTEVYLPLLEELLDGGIERYAADIEAAAAMNQLRWPSANPMGNSIDTLQQYVSTRKDFLSSAWVEGKEYCTVHFEANPGEFYYNASVEKGGILKTERIDLENTVWLVEQTGQVFDPCQPVYKDMVLIKKPAAQANQVAPVVAMQDLIIAASLCGMAVLLGGLIWVDVRRRRKECGNEK